MTMRTDMKTVTAKEARIRFGEVLESAQHEPVRISKNGRPYAVILSAREHDALVALEDAYWLKRAKEAEKDGYLGPDEGDKLLRDLMNARA